MKLIPQKTQKKLNPDQSAEHSKVRFPYIFPIFGLLLGAVIVLFVIHANGGRTFTASDSHVVFLFDKGERRAIDSKAETVGELVKKLNLKLIPQDVVEPSLDTPIPEDNFRINIYRARPVTVVDNHQKTVTLTAQKSPWVVAKDAGLKVYPEDKVTFAQGSLQENIIGEKVNVRPATPVRLNLYGTDSLVRTQAKTVGDLLTEKRITLQEGETVRPKTPTAIKRNLPIFVLRKNAKIITVKKTVEPPLQVINDPSLSFGTEAVRQQGSPGKELVTYLITVKKGKEVKRQIIQKVVVQDPVPKIVARGSTIDIAGNKTSVMAAAGIGSGDYAYVNFVISRESNWNPGALNAGGCAGLGQACPGGKLAAVCPGWQHDPVCQLRFFSGYAGRYGGWGGAYNYWLGHGYW